MRIVFITLTLLASAYLHGQSPMEKRYFKLLRAAFSEQHAYQSVAFVEQRWRLAGNSGFNESIFHVEKILQQAGFVKEVHGEADGPLTYRIEKRPMNHPTWEPVDAQLFIVGEKEPLLQFTTNRNMIPINAASTPDTGITAQLEFVSKLTDSFETKGKVLIADSDIGSLHASAIKRGAVGVLAYSLPRYNQPEKNQHSIQFQGIAYTDAAQHPWALLLSYAAKERLKAAHAKGPVFVKAIIKTKRYQSEELTIVANVRGALLPQERFVYSAHVQEPGANDNATGVATLAEMARVTASLVRKKKFKPLRTLTFLWGDEIISTDRYIKDDSIRAKGIRWGLSLDMVGEDTKKTGGTFLIEKMPDPSAVWTRGEEKHSEWGGSPLQESQLFPHYFNDLLLNRCLYQAKKTGWVVKTNPFEGGSDHTPFLRAQIPGLLMWHFTDQFYHTDRDRLDKVSASEMKNVGVSALATAYLLASANTKTAAALIDDITKNALQRLQTEFLLSKGGDKAREQHILEVWADYYVKALAATIDIAATGADATIEKAIQNGQQRIQQQLSFYISSL